MAVSERERLVLYEQLTEEVGPGLAETLMDHIPSVKWDELATKDDLRQMGDQLRSELRSEMREGFTAMELRLTERFAEQTRWMADRFAEQDRRLTEKFEEQDRRIAEMDRRFTDRLAEQTRKTAEQTRIIVLALIGLGVTMWGSLLGSGFF